jgi:general secretion pathway protein J
MREALARRCGGEGGFTLIETLVALALTGLVLSALANITAQWMPHWNSGIDRIQRSEVLGIALQRIGADLAAAEYIPPNRDLRRPLFEGSELSVTFVRTAFGPNAATGLNVVRVGETSDAGGLVMVRSQTPFRPLPPASSLSEQLHFGAPVVLLRAPFRLSFAYAGPDRIWKSSWRGADKLPALIKLTVRDAVSGRTLSVSTVTPVHVQTSRDCLQPDGSCEKSDALKTPADQSSAGNAPAAQGAAL